jgi:tetratricopeptide (TPR) repeat protein
LIEDLTKVLPTLQADGYRQVRVTESLAKPRTYSASALTTITETLRRPGPSRGTLILAVLAVIAVVLFLVLWLKPQPHKPTPEAAHWYEKGTEALRNGAFQQATKALDQAIAHDPKFALAHARLAEAWNEMDYSDKAKDEMLRARSLEPNPSRLARTDALYLDAINATLTRDHEAAIKAYKELVSLAPDDPQVYLDLGRAYEKNDQINDAIKSYVEATTRAPQYATSYLRVGSLYARQLDQASAIAAFDKAETIFQANGNFEGQAEVSFQRGYLFDQLNKETEAREHLQRALELARTTGNDYQYVKSLLKLGYVELSNNLEGARAYMREAVERAQAKGIDNLTKQGIGDIGNTYLYASDYPEAEKYYRQSLDLAQKQNDERNASRALLQLASLAERRGNPNDVINYINQALPFYQKGGYRKETLQAFALLARGKVHQGDYAGALDGYQQVLKLSQQLDDQGQAVLAHDDIGRLFIRQGRYPEALEHLDESYKTAKAINSPKNVALSLTDRANALWRLGRYDGANAALQEAKEYVEKPGAPSNISAAYYLVLARIALSRENWRDVQSYAKTAETLAGSSQLHGAAAEASLTLCLSQVFSGAAKQGAAKCQQAVDAARQANDPAVFGESLLAQAEASARAGDADAATKNALEAQQIFARSGRRDCEWEAWLIAARACRASGDIEKTREYASKAQQVLSSIQQQWGDDSYDSYLNRPDVQLSRKQLSEIVGKP